MRISARQITIQGDAFPGFDSQLNDFVCVAHPTRFIRLRMYRRRNQAAGLPSEVYGVTTASAEAGNGAIGPGIGQGREQIQDSFLALEEHFSDGGGDAEIGVNLKGRTGVEEIGVDAAAAVVANAQSGDRVERRTDEQPGGVAIAQPGG